MTRVIPAPFLLAVVCGLFLPTQAPGQDPTSPSAADFNQLGSALVPETLDAAAAVSDLQKRVSDAARFVTDAQATAQDLKAGGPRSRTLAVVFDAMTALASRSAPLRQATGYDQVAGRVAQIRGSFDAAATLTDAQLNQLVQDLSGLVTVAANLTRLANAARATEAFLTTEFQQAIETPVQVGPVMLQILGPPSGPLFGPGASIGVKVSYAGGYTIEATGLRLIPRQTPQGWTVTFDPGSSLKATNQTPAIAQAALDGIAGALPSFGLPVTLDGAPKFQSLDHFPSPVIVPITASIPGFQDLPQAKASFELTIPLSGKPTLKFTGASTQIEVPPYPLGTTPLVVTAITIGFAEGPNTLTLGLVITAGDVSVVTLNVAVKMALPFDPSKGFAIDGTVQIQDQGSNQTVGHVTAFISPKEITGTLTIPGSQKGDNNSNGASSSIGDVVNARFNFLLDREKLSADGLAVLFKVINMNASLLLSFANGSGTFTGGESVEVLDFDGDASFSAGFTKGFKEIHAQFAVAVDVDLGIMRPRAMVTIGLDKGASDRLPVPKVTAAALGVSVDVPIDGDLKNLNLARIVQALRQRLGDALDNLGRAAATWEGQKTELFAKWESHWRDTLSAEAAKRGIGSISTGIPPIDNLLGDLAKGIKNPAGWTSTAFKSADKSVTDFLKNLQTNPLDALKDAGYGVGYEYKILDQGRDSAKQVVNAVKSAGSKFDFNQFSNAVNTVVNSNVVQGVESAVANPVHTAQTLLGRGGGSGGGGNNSSQRSPGDIAQAQAAAAQLQSELALVERMAPVEQAANSLRVTLRGLGDDGSRYQLVVQGTAAAIVRDGGVDTLALLLHLNASRVAPQAGASTQVSVIVPVRVQFGTGTAGDAGPNTAQVFLDGPDLATDPGDAARKFRQAVGPLRATVIARHALQDMVAAQLPATRFAGERKFVEKRLSIANATDRPLTVFVQARTRQAVSGALQWTWQPGGPGTAAAQRFLVPAGPASPFLLREDTGRGADDYDDQSSPLHASRVRLWAEAPDGERWNDHREVDLMLVETDPSLGGERAYDATEPRTVVYTIRSRQAPPLTSVVLHQTGDAQYERQGDVSAVVAMPQELADVDPLVASLEIDALGMKTWRPLEGWSLKAVEPAYAGWFADAAGLAAGPPLAAPRIVALQVPPASVPGQPRRIRMRYHLAAAPWEPRYEIDLAAPTRTLEGRAFVRNDSATGWRNIDLAVRMGGTASGARPFPLGRVSLERGASLLLPLPASQIETAIEDVLVFESSTRPGHPTRALAVFNRSAQPLPAGPVAILSDRNFLTRSDMSALAAKHTIHPRDWPALIRYPGNPESAVTVCDTNVEGAFIHRGRRICAGTLFYAVDRREIAYCVEHGGARANVVVIRPAEPGWRAVMQTVVIGDRPSPEYIRIRQDGDPEFTREMDLRKIDLKDLRRLTFPPEDRIGAVVSSVRDWRIAIADLLSARQRLEKMGPELLPEVERNKAAEAEHWKEIDRILADPALCLPHCECGKAAAADPQSRGSSSAR